MNSKKNLLLQLVQACRRMHKMDETVNEVMGSKNGYAKTSRYAVLGMVYIDVRLTLSYGT